MWRRVTSLSPTLYPSRSTLLDQGANGFTIWRSASTQKNPFIAFVLGGPGSGKGTQCVKIVETFGLTHLSAGDMLRREIQSKTEYGDMILNKIRNGKIVPSEVTVKLIQRIGLEPNMVLFFDSPEEEMIKRVLSRNQGRDDDNIETMKKRLRIFEALSLPVVNYYVKKGKLHKRIFISSSGPVVYCPEEEMIKRVLSRNQGRDDDNIETMKKRLRIFEALSLPVVNYYDYVKKGKLHKISAVGTVDEVFEKVHPIFAACKAIE